jgi:hypothetical protein
MCHNFNYYMYCISGSNPICFLKFVVYKMNYEMVKSGMVKLCHAWCPIRQEGAQEPEHMRRRQQRQLNGAWRHSVTIFSSVG